MTFELDKKNALNRKDKSKKQAVDKDIKKLVEAINSMPNYYTTSSCSGRILLISFPEENRKYNVEWLFVTHDKVDFDVIKNNLQDIDLKKNKNCVWFKEESMIMHICCRTLDDASWLVEIAKHIGFKRSGINTLKNRIVLELLSTERMDVPVVRDGRLLVDDDYLRILVEEANKKMAKTKEKIQKLYDKITSL